MDAPSLTASALFRNSGLQESAHRINTKFEAAEHTANSCTASHYPTYTYDLTPSHVGAGIPSHVSEVLRQRNTIVHRDPGGQLSRGDPTDV